MSLNESTRTLIKDVYGHVPLPLADGLAHLLEASSDSMPTDDSEASSSEDSLWDHRDIVLITYADQVRQDDCCPLEAQRRFLLEHDLKEQLQCVHLLPFCPATGDDGFSVSDYLSIDPDFGDWDDVHRLGQDFDLMYDLVLNHSSKSHAWFQAFLQDDPEFADFYQTADPDVDLSQVVRPRSLPLLTEFSSASGPRHVWTTFSEDQVDLNYQNPRVMLAMIETLVEYARRGARIIRLDAIAFLWKEIGTNCLHLPQTHAAVKLMRHVLDQVVPGTLVLTETNVPHAENISYFGAGDDEAHMVYQFSLPPLLLDAIHSGDCSVLAKWMSGLQLPSRQTTYFNFTASHDGIGVRPAEGLVPTERIEKLVQIVRQHGGAVGMRKMPDGSESPYELNITYLDAIADRAITPPAEHAKRFLATQAIMLSMQGMPAVYFHSLVGSPSDIEAMKTSGIPRRINRHKYDREELESALRQDGSLQQLVFEGYRHLLSVRRQQQAFHPEASQRVLELPTDGLLGLVRQLEDGSRLTVLANLGDRERTVSAAKSEQAAGLDVLSEETVGPGEDIQLAPFQVRWICQSA